MTDGLSISDQSLVVKCVYEQSFPNLIAPTVDVITTLWTSFFAAAFNAANVPLTAGWIKSFSFLGS